MLGAFDIQLKDAKGLTDADFLALKAESPEQYRKLLADLPVLGEYQAQNQVFDNVVAYLFQHSFLTSPGAALPYSRTFFESALARIQLMSTSSTPTYTEFDNDQFIEPRFQAGSTPASDISNSKRFLIDDVEDELVYKKADLAIFNGDLQEALYFRSRFVWLPSEGVASDIRSIGIFFSDNHGAAGNVGQWYGRTARTRITDSGGNPQTINKTVNQVLQIQYTFGLVSI